MLKQIPMRAETVLKAVIEKELARGSASLFGAFIGGKENA